MPQFLKRPHNNFETLIGVVQNNF